VASVLATHLFRAYNAKAELLFDLRGGLGPARERRVRRYIEQSLEGDLSIEALAKVSGLSANYFADVFRRTTGFTPHNYVNHRRVDRARQLLTDVELPLTEVAHRCGFKSQSQFTTIFRQLTGVTPGKFRASMPLADNVAGNPV
jgi:AraC family transcriptional regulator